MHSPTNAYDHVYRHVPVAHVLLSCQWGDPVIVRHFNEYWWASLDVIWHFVGISIVGVRGSGTTRFEFLVRNNGISQQNFG